MALAHRDIHPSNIFYMRKPEGGGRFLLGDFSKSGRIGIQDGERVE